MTNAASQVVEMYCLLDEASTEVVRKADDFALEDGHQMISWQRHQIRLEPAQALQGAAQYLCSPEGGHAGPRSRTARLTSELAPTATAAK